MTKLHKAVLFDKIEAIKEADKTSIEELAAAVYRLTEICEDLLIEIEV
jgi:hypothetical protein